MRFGPGFYLIRKNMSQNFGRTLLACGGVGIGMAIVMAAASVAMGIQFHVVKRLRESMPERVISVQRTAIDLGPLRMRTSPITDEDIKRLKAMPEVESVWPQVPIQFPIRAEGELIGVELTTDVVVNGIEPALVQEDVAEGKVFAFSDDPMKPIPVMVSRYLLDMYNLGYAKANSLPELSEKWAIGRHFSIVLGQSTVPAMGNGENARAVRAEVVGLTSNPSLLGVVMPAEYVQRFNREFSSDKSSRYSALHLQLHPKIDMDAFEKKLSAMNLKPDAQRELIRRVQFFLKIILLVLVIFSGLVLFVAFSNVINTFSLILLQRRFEIGLLRAVGTTRNNVVLLYAGEAASVGAVGGVLGALLAFLLAQGVNTLCKQYLPPLSILPQDQSFLVFTWGLAGAGILFAILASVMVTLPIVWKATGDQPARLMRQA